jgi:hypothetical protein
MVPFSVVLRRKAQADIAGNTDWLENRSGTKGGRSLAGWGVEGSAKGLGV